MPQDLKQLKNDFVRFPCVIHALIGFSNATQIEALDQSAMQQHAHHTGLAITFVRTTNVLTTASARFPYTQCVCAVAGLLLLLDA